MSLDSSLIFNTQVYDTIKEIAHCCICTGILIEPQQCLSCDSCFCKKCLLEWQSKSKSCPFKCKESSFKDSRIVKQMLHQLTFKCPFKCDKIISYDSINKHEDVCENLTTECPTCQTVVSKSRIKISEYDKTIKSLKDEIEKLKKNVFYANDIPTMFQNGKIFETPTGNYLRTITSANVLPENFIINIKLKKLLHPGYIVIGVSDKIINENKGYLGGDMGKGNWGIAGNGSMGEEGTWHRTKGFQQGDTLTLKGRGSVIGFNINGEHNSYSYDLKRKSLYFSISYYHEKEVLELIVP